MSTREKVVEIVSQTLEFPIEEIGESDAFLDDLGASSLDVVNLVWRIEEAFALGETPDSALENIETVGDLIEFVEERRGHQVSEAADVVDVALASDHAGVAMKSALVDYLRRDGRTLVDLGPSDATSVDYPEFAERVARKVASGEADRGILICGSGIGMSIAANKVDGVRAALVMDPLMAELSRQHNDANVLCLGARLIGETMAEACTDAFLSTSFDPGDDGRHRRRVSRMSAIGRES
jgi:ribose 5-phosphate isomerase B